MKTTPIIPMQKFQHSDLPIKVQTIQELRVELDDNAQTVHCHNYYEMIWVISGKGKLCVDLKEFFIRKNMIFCLRPNQPHEFQMDEETDGFAISFTDSFFNMAEQEFDWTCKADLSRLFLHNYIVSIAPESAEFMETVARNMLKEFNGSLSFRSQLLQRFFRILLIYLSRHLTDPCEFSQHKKDMRLVKDFFEHLDKGFKEKKMVTDYAQTLSVTPNYLSHIVKINTGFSAGYHIRQRVIFEAKRLGKYSDAGMKKIADDLGFSNIAHFSKYFKQFSGANFSKFIRAEVRVSIDSSVSARREL